MKGIAGIVYPNVFQVNQTINPMLSCLQSGSDAKSGSHLFKNIEIGCAGAPMCCNGKKTLYVALFGFLDNAPEMIKELNAKGYRLNTPSDEEIILHAYEAWGKDFLIKIKGSFAIALLDQEKEKLLLARDSTGKKTLYWYQDQNRFLFSNQLKALLATGFVPQTPDPEALAAFLYFGYCPQDLTPVKGVNRLLPGYYLELERDGSMAVQCYWSYSSFFEKKSPPRKDAILPQLDHLLARAVEKHIPKNQTIGCFLSGGLGSSSVAYYLKKLAGSENVKAFSVGFEDEYEEDIYAATEVANELHIAQRRLMLTPKNFLNDFVRITWHLDEPLADFSTIATWNLSKLASAQTTIVYSGLGSDELFAGHCRYTTSERPFSLFSKLSGTILPPVAHWFAPVLNMIYKPAAYALLKHARADGWQLDYMKHNALFSERELNRAAPKLKDLFDPELFLNKFYHIQRIRSSTSAFLYFDVKTRMADLYTLQNEKLTSAFNLDWYSPFLNRDVVEFAASLPEPEDLPEKDAAMYLKGILKNLLPESVLNRPKKSRPHFLASWLEQSELPKLFQTLMHGTLVEEGYISEDWLLQRIASPETMRASFRQLWTLLTLETWFRIFINRSIDDTPPEVTLLELLSED